MRICKNEITNNLRKLFGANPLRVPETLYQPLLVLEIKNRRPFPLGDFESMIKGLPNFNVNIQTSEVSEISDFKTQSMSLGVGLDILGNFIKAFGINPSVIELGMRRTRKIGFSFSNVERKYFSPLQFGKVLSENKILCDIENIFIRKFLSDKRSQLAIVTDVIVSDNFSLLSYDESNNKVEIDVPAIQDSVANMGIDVIVSSDNANIVKFKKQTKPLTFAFSCVEIKIDEKGRFASGDWLFNLRSKGINSIDEFSVGETEKEIKILFDDDEFRPLLIE